MPQCERVMHSWIRLRQDLYDQVQNHVKALLGPASEGLARYQREYDNEFRKAWKPAPREQLLKDVEEAPFVLMGDFHALQQSQKAHLRIIKALSLKKERILCLECVEARHQRHLDRFIAGKMSEREFLKAVEWKRNWGFPWEHYKPLFRLAMKQKIRVFGINSKSQDHSALALKARDQFSAQKIAEIHRRYPGHQLLIIYGDLHLAAHHLPQKLKKILGKKVESQMLFVFQNSERIYFQMLKKEIEHQVDVVKLSKRHYCLQNVPPWVKWQNYLLYLEQQYDQSFDDEIDFTDYIAKYVQVISNDLGIPNKVDHFSVFSAADRGVWAQIQKGLKPSEILFLKSWIEDGRSFYLAPSSIGYLARGSVNSAAQLAMAIVASSLSQQKKIPHQLPQDFSKLIWMEAVQYFGSKLINPKRKSDTLTDIKAALTARSPMDKGREALQLALSQKMLELLHLSGSKRDKELARSRSLKAYQEAARILGGMLGEKLYFAVRKKMLSKTSLISLLKKPLDAENFQNIYWEILEVVENFPEPFQSKTEKM